MTELIQEYSLTQLITEDSHFTEDSLSLIGLILTRNKTHLLTSGVMDTFISNQTRYHCLTIVLLNCLRPVSKTYTKRILNYKLVDFDKFRSSLTEYNLTVKVEETTDLGINAQQITDSLIYEYAAEMSIPNKVVTIRSSESPWITSKVKKLTRKRNRLHKRFKRTNNLIYWESYKNIRNLTVTELRNSKKNYFDKIDELLSTSTRDSKIFWKTAKQFLRKSSSSISTLKLNDYYAEDDLQKANLLNTYFISQSNVIDDNKSLPELEPTQHSLNVIQITYQDVRDVLRNLNVSKSFGPDLISPRLLREGADILDKPFSFVFNRSIDKCYFPSPWKDGNVTPIYKNDDKSAPSNYRPITLLRQWKDVFTSAFTITL